MKFEHFALNTPDARAVTRWYVENLGLRIARQMDAAPYTAFLADDTGRLIVELYTRTDAAIPDYAAAHPLCFHLAFVSGDNDTIRAKLVAAGADKGYEETTPDGSRLLMMRDPWGIPLQFCHRTKPFGPVAG
jgi:glyoxylase I family protein